MSDIDTILNERGVKYGLFKNHAVISQQLKTVMHENMSRLMEADQLEALDMIAHKIARVLNGDPNYADSWVDIAGYAQLVANRLQGTVR